MEGGTPLCSTNSLASQEATSQDSTVRESISTEWTDEKHSLYLKSMEASFVNDLYNSFDSLGFRSKNEHSTYPKICFKRSNGCISSGQYKVLRGGCWEMVRFDKHNSQMDNEDESRVLLTNPWIRHFRSNRRQQILTYCTLQENVGRRQVHVSGKMALTAADLAANLKLPVRHLSFCRYDSVGSNTEVSDQNFVDEDNKAEKANHVCKAKRRKTSSVATSHSDQVVPFGNYPTTEVVTEKTLSTGKGKAIKRR